METFDPDEHYRKLYWKLEDKVPVRCLTREDYYSFMENKSNWRVDETYIGEARISTVFLGLDHNHSWPNGTPILFETMIFGGEHDDFQERYCTWDEAEAGHKIAVDLVEGK